MSILINKIKKKLIKEVKEKAEKANVDIEFYRSSQYTFYDVLHTDTCTCIEEKDIRADENILSQGIIDVETYNQTILANSSMSVSDYCDDSNETPYMMIVVIG